MVRSGIDEIFKREGYRFCQVKPEEVEVYYRYYREGFHVVLVIDLEHGYSMTPGQHHIMEERIMGMFYHPQGVLADFPDGFPVYHVEVLTVLVGNQDEGLRLLCAECRNVWGYLPEERRLLIYENQPGDFFGLRQVFENDGAEHREAERGGGYTLNFLERIKNFRWDRNLPYVTVGLAVVNVVIYLIVEFLSAPDNSLFIAQHGGMYPTFLLYQHQWWRLVTAGFLHFDPSHLVNNMLILCCMGFRMEREVGHLRLFVIYMVSMLGGSALSFIMMLLSGHYAISAGASGAVFGLIGGFLWMVIRHKGRLAGISTRGILFMMLLTIYYGFSSEGIDNWGHIGGAVTGFLVTIILYQRKCQKD